MFVILHMREMLTVHAVGQFVDKAGWSLICFCKHE